MPNPEIKPKIYFSDFFNVSEKSLEDYGAFNTTVITDLPLFIDPFLLFHSRKTAYQKLHSDVISYLCFLRDNSSKAENNRGLMEAWFYFREVKQTWLGFSASGNEGRGLGKKFAQNLIIGFREWLNNFGSESFTDSHLEKLCLISGGVGRDMISDLITNLVKSYLLEYTQDFAREHIAPSLITKFQVSRSVFNYETCAWQTVEYDLPVKDGDFVLLTPKDLLTKDDTWINKSDLYKGFDRLPDAVTNTSLRAQVNDYFKRILPKNPKKRERDEAIRKVLEKFPTLLDYYILGKERTGAEAERQSARFVEESESLYINQFREFINYLANKTEFYKSPAITPKEVLERIKFLKDAIENKGCHRIFYLKGKPIRKEDDLQILFRLTWFGTGIDISREVNDGRGPVDFKASLGAVDKTLVEMKLASNSKLESNLEKQVEIYQKASDAPFAYKVILYFTDAERAKLQAILRRLKLERSEWIITIDGRNNNKPSGSAA